MIAQEIVKSVVAAEDLIQRAISESIALHLNLLSSGTGLKITGVHIDLIDVTSISDKHNKVAVGKVDIMTELPGKAYV